MNIDSLKSKLGDETFAQLQAHIDDLTGQRDTARQESISGRRKLKEEVDNLRNIKTKLFEKLGLGDDDDIDSIPDSKGQAEASKQFEAKIKRLERELATATAKAGEVESKYRSSRQEAALSKALSSFEFTDNDLMASYVGQKVVWEDDQIMFKADDGRLMPLTDGVKQIAQTKPHLLKAKGAGGSGHAPNGAGSSSGQKTMSRADYEALPGQQKVELAKSGIQLT